MSAGSVPAPILVVLGGLPGVGKSTVARVLLTRWAAVYLRIDTIEQALRGSGALVSGDVGPAGYLVAYALARSQLEARLPVLADCVNPLPVTREAWRAVARESRVPILEVELICSDTAEHRHRVATRPGDVAGLVLPTWQAVERHDYALWEQERLIVDTACHSADEAADLVLGALRRCTAGVAAAVDNR